MSKTITRSCLTAIVVLGGLLVEPAIATVSVQRAELSGSRLRLEGTATPARDIAVDGRVLGRSDGSGAFRIERDPFAPPADCTLDVNDGSATATVARLTGCTVSQPTSPPPGDGTAPTAPAGLTATPAGTTANLRWTASSDNVGVVGYRVRRNGTVLSGTVSGTTFADSGLPAGDHVYTVSAVDAAGNVSAASNTASVTIAPPAPAPPDTTAPTAPTNLTAVLTGGNIAELRWTPSTDDTAVTGYRVTRNGEYRYTRLNPFDSDSNLAVGTYTYTVAAVDGAGNISAASNSVSVTVPPPPAVDMTAPTVPAGLGTTVVGSTVSLGWNLSADDTAVTGYTVRRNGAIVATTATTTFLDSGLAPGTYTYTVAAFDGAGNTSAQSTSVSATVQSTAFGFLTPSQLPDAIVGQPYLASIVVDDPPGPSTFRFRLVSGSVPPGTQFLRNTLETRPEARVSGTPTTAGTYSFTVEVRLNTGATVRRTFSIRVLAR